MTDQELVADFLDQRDGTAFEGLLRRHGPMVFRICRDVLADPSDAEEAFQATFLVLFRQAGAIRDRASVGRWLCEVAWRISRRERRRLARLRSQERQALAMDPAAPPDPDPADGELRPLLQEEVRRLPAKLRDPVLLCYYEGLTVEEAARRLGIPAGTFKSRLGRAREVLRSRLTRRGMAASALLLLMFTLTEEVPAAVSPTLIDATLEAGPGGAGVSGRVASMVRAEEARTAWALPGAPWFVLGAILLGLGAIRLAAASHAFPEVSAAAEVRAAAPVLAAVEPPAHCNHPPPDPPKP